MYVYYFCSVEEKNEYYTERFFNAICYIGTIGTD